MTDQTPAPSSAPIEMPAPDPEKLLAAWMDWERGESTPGRVMADLKTGGMPQLLAALVEQKRTGTGS